MQVTKANLIGYRMSKSEFALLSSAMGFTQVVGINMNTVLDQNTSDNDAYWRTTLDILEQKKYIQRTNEAELQVDSVISHLLKICCAPKVLLITSTKNRKGTLTGYHYINDDGAVSVEEDLINFNDLILSPNQYSETLFESLCQILIYNIQNIKIYTNLFEETCVEQLQGMLEGIFHSDAASLNTLASKLKLSNDAFDDYSTLKDYSGDERSLQVIHISECSQHVKSKLIFTRGERYNWGFFSELCEDSGSVERVIAAQTDKMKEQLKNVVSAELSMVSDNEEDCTYD